MKYKFGITILAILITGVFSFWFSNTNLIQEIATFLTAPHTASVSDSIVPRRLVAINDLEKKFSEVKEGKKTPIRILVVPGHEPNYGGAQFGNVLERDIVALIGQNLSHYLGSDNRFETFVTRGTETWNPEFSEYFNNEWQNIIAWKNDANDMIRHLTANGGWRDVSADGVQHASAPQDVAIRLYGINKWVNENNIDIVVHLHTNDYPRKKQSLPGQYSGLAIYVPEYQYNNSQTSSELGRNILYRLNKFFPVSNYPKESVGIVDDQELIAVGSNNTVDGASVLIEYGYTYEPHFASRELHDVITKEMAYQTYLGILDFLKSEKNVLRKETTLFPFEWTNNELSKKEIFILQAGLGSIGLYPPQGKSVYDCPLTGIIGPCTKESIKNLQEKYNIENSGNVGPKTRDLLNSLFGKNSN